MDRCLECDFDYASATPGTAPDLIGAFPARYRAAVVGIGDAVLRTKPGPWTWSALEYLCHVRDVFALYRARAELVQREDHPHLPPMGRDDLAITERYNEQDPATVIHALDAEAVELVRFLRALPPDGWSRAGLQQVGERDVAWMAANTVHEARHHLTDIERVLSRVSGRPSP